MWSCVVWENLIAFIMQMHKYLANCLASADTMFIIKYLVVFAHLSSCAGTIYMAIINTLKGPRVSTRKYSLKSALFAWKFFIFLFFFCLPFGSVSLLFAMWLIASAMCLQCLLCKFRNLWLFKNSSPHTYYGMVCWGGAGDSVAEYE